MARLPQLQNGLIYWPTVLGVNIADRLLDGLGQGRREAPREAVEGVTAYVAQNTTRAQQNRAQYNRKVAKLGPIDGAERTRLKEATRASDPAPQRALVGQVRPSTAGKSPDGAARTNAGWTRRINTVGHFGRGFGVAGGLLGLAEILTSDDKPRAAGQVLGSMAGGTLGGIVGAEGGAVAGSEIPVLGTTVGAVGGGIGGSIYGGIKGGEAGEDIVDWMRRRRNQTGTAKR